MKNLRGQLHEYKRVLFTTHGGSQRVIVIVFRHPVNFNPKQYSELRDMGKWTVSNDMCRYFLTCAAKKSPIPIIKNVLNTLDLEDYKLRYVNSQMSSLYD